MTILHLVANRVLPHPGGLQESVIRIGRSLASAGFRVIVYTLYQPAEYRCADPSHQGLQVLHLGGRELLLGPYLDGGAPELLATERSRVTALLLRNAIERRTHSEPDARHVVISFYASGTGFLAQMAAASLRLPHIVSVRGTDFELDVFGAKQHPRLRAAIDGAAQVITTNREQADALSAMFHPRRTVRTIHNALPDAGARPFWKTPPVETIRLISDCGFSGRKATHLLLRAAASLMDQGFDASLTVLGSTFWLESPAYWEERRREYESSHPGRFFFPGQVSHEELDRRLLSSHIYCSASLAEGSSMSRIRALTLGIPMVTTANGGMPELAAGCRHVRLCPAGDWQALAAETEAAAGEIRAGTLEPDERCVARWREHFRVERERDEWVRAIELVLREEAARV
ncbi:MAG: glycosyltransferase family 4 protein [Bryobacteraceae bacterium]|nr:glycosyltransferase family 4 protein [Bryobacteraceae bacterium]